MYNSIDCYEESGRSLPKNTLTLYLPSFTVSATKNKFVAIGCDTYAYFNNYLNDQPLSIDCLSYCQNISNVVNGMSFGIGCCKIQILEGFKNVDFTAYSFNDNHTKVWDFNPCNFALIVQEDKFNFSLGYLTSLRNNLTLLMVLDWTIGNETCKVAQNKANYICGANSTSSDLNNESGYRCKCEDGYKGNLYLKQGCQGIYLIYLQISTTKIKKRNTITIF